MRKEWVRFPACALKQGTFFMLASSADRDVNGGSVGQN